MKFFSLSLRDQILTHFDNNQRSFSRRTKIAAGAISKYTRGLELPSPDNLARILAALPHSQGDLLTAFFRDIAAQAGVHDIRVAVSRGSERPMKMDAKVEALVARVEDLIRRNTKFRAIVELLAESA